MYRKTPRSHGDRSLVTAEKSYFKNRKFYKSVCPYCGVGCGVILETENGKVTGVNGDPDHPSNYGRLCTKGKNLAKTIHKHDRLRYPMFRENRNSQFLNTSWDDALGNIADKIKSIISVHGPEAVAFHISGQLLTEDYYAVNKLSKGFLKVNNLDSNSRLCMSSAVMGYRRAFGVDAPPCSYEDLEHTDCVFIIGSNMAHCHPVVFMRLAELKELKGDSLKIIVADPRLTATAGAADIFLPVIPGTDVALLNSLAHVLIEEDLIDADFIDSHTDGFNELKSGIKDFSPEKVSKICGVEPQKIYEAALTFGKAKAAMTFWAMGLNQSSFGTDKNNALLNLSIITGNIGKLGAGPFSLTGQANAMGGRETGGLANIIPGHRYMTDQKHRKEVEDIWKCGPLSAQRGLTAVEIFDGLHKGTIKAIWIVCTNPVVSMPNGNKVAQALKKAELVVVQDIFHPTDTSLFADFLLPAAGFSEKEGSMTNQERRISYISKAANPPGQAKPDWKIFTDFAHHMELGEYFPYSEAEQIFEEYKLLTKGQDLDITGVTYSRIKTEGPIQWPCTAQMDPGTPRLYTDSVFHTDTRRAKIVNVDFNYQQEPADDKYPLILTTGRIRDQWHTMTKTGKVEELLLSDTEPVLQISEEDASDREIKDGDLVVAESRRGKCTIKCSVSRNISRGTVFLPFHWGNLFADNGMANLLTIEAIDAVSQQPEFKACAIEVKKKIFDEKTDVLIIGEGKRMDTLAGSIKEINKNVSITKITTGKNTKIEFFDPQSKKIRLGSTEELSYDKLIVVPGQISYLPAVKGVFTDGVHIIKNYSFTKKKIGKMFTHGRTAVVGSSPMSFMVAELLMKRGAERVHLISPFNIILDRYIDYPCSEMLYKKIGKHGIELILGAEIDEIIEENGSKKILLGRGKEIAVDNIFVEPRLRPNLNNALELGLLVNKGIVVGEKLETSIKNVYSFGPSAEVMGNISKDSELLSRQSKTIARIVSGDPTATYKEKFDVTRFSLFNMDFISFGEFNSDDEKANVLSYIDKGKPAYKKIVVRDNEIVGGLYAGDSKGADEILKLAREKKDISKYRSGLLSGKLTSALHAGKIVCACASVTEKEIETAIINGMSIENIKESLKAGITCGTCLQDIKSLYNVINNKH